MSDEDIRNTLDGDPGDGPASHDGATPDGGASLGDDIERRYLEMGVHMLSDDIPRRLDERTQDRLEKLLGRDLSRVRVHTGERAQRAATAMGAQAFALGEKDVFFGPGSYDPSTREGIGLLAHEVAHTVEAGQPGGAPVGFKGEPSKDGRGEAFAEAAEGRALAEEPTAKGGEAGRKGKKARRPDYLKPDVVERAAWQKLRDLALLDRDRHGSF